MWAIKHTLLIEKRERVCYYMGEGSFGLRKAKIEYKSPEAAADELEMLMDFIKNGRILKVGRYCCFLRSFDRYDIELEVVPV